MGTIFNQKTSLADLLCYIPDEEILKLAFQSKVDHYAKVLNGRLMFYLLLSGILRTDKLSQRGLADSFSSPLFRTLFNFKGKATLSHSSISDRLSTMNLDFFRSCYETIYGIFHSLYSQSEIDRLCLQRVDSTLVSESCNHLKKGLSCGNLHMKKQMLKYTLNFDGMFASCATVHTEPSSMNEAVALPENVMSHFQKIKDHSCVYILERGQNSAEAFKDMNSHDGLRFVGRLTENRKLHEVKDIKDPAEAFEYGELLEDRLVKLYKRIERINKDGRVTVGKELAHEVFRVVRFKPQRKNEILLITNCLELKASDIARIYRRRWDIEVFFRFLKQELNFSHFLSMNENGIQIVMYMTLITAMLVMIYKRENQVGYTTAVRRMGIELEALIMAIVVIESGGDIRKTQLMYPYRI